MLGAPPVTIMVHINYQSRVLSTEIKCTLHDGSAIVTSILSKCNINFACKSNKFTVVSTYWICFNIMRCCQRIKKYTNPRIKNKKKSKPRNMVILLRFKYIVTILFMVRVGAIDVKERQAGQESKNCILAQSVGGCFFCFTLFDTLLNEKLHAALLCQLIIFTVVIYYHSLFQQMAIQICIFTLTNFVSVFP